MIRNNRYEEETQELFEEFETEYLQIGIEIMTSINRVIILITILSAVLFLGPNNPFYWRAITIWPCVFIVFWLIDKFWRNNRHLTEYLLILIVFIIGISMTYAGLKKTEYSFYEMWVGYILLCQYFGILMFANWIKIVTSFSTVFILYITLAALNYSDIPLVFYLSSMNTLI